MPPPLLWGPTRSQGPLFLRDLGPSQAPPPNEADWDRTCLALAGREPAGRATALVGREGLALVGRDITRSQVWDLPRSENRMDGERSEARSQRDVTDLPGEDPFSVLLVKSAWCRQGGSGPDSAPP